MGTCGGLKLVPLWGLLLCGVARTAHAGCDPELAAGAVLVVGGHLFAPPCTVERGAAGEAIIDGQDVTELIRGYLDARETPGRPADPFGAMKFDRSTAMREKVLWMMEHETITPFAELEAFLLALPYVESVDVPPADAIRANTPGVLTLTQFGIVTSDCSHPAASAGCVDGDVEYFDFGFPGQAFPDPLRAHFGEAAKLQRVRELLSGGQVVMFGPAGSFGPKMSYDAACVRGVVLSRPVDAVAARGALEACGLAGGIALPVSERMTQGSAGR